MYVRIEFDEHNRPQNYVVEYRAEIEGEWVAVRRHDNRHGRPHIDTFDPVKGQSKQWLDELNIEQGLERAISDLADSHNWHRYRERYTQALRKAGGRQ